MMKYEKIMTVSGTVFFLNVLGVIVTIDGSFAIALLCTIVAGICLLFYKTAERLQAEQNERNERRKMLDEYRRSNGSNRRIG